VLDDSRLADAVGWARLRGASYADARWVEREHESVALKDGEIESVDRSSDRGVGLRVLRGGAWGFSATDRLGPAALRGLVDEAFRRADAAGAAGLARRPVVLAPEAPRRGTYRTPFVRDPFAVPHAERVALLREADAALEGPSTRLRRAGVDAYRMRKRLVTSEGTDVTQEIVECGSTLTTVAVEAGRRPASRSDMRDVRQAGWEYVEARDLPRRAAAFRDEAHATLVAPAAEPGPTTLVFDPSFLALLVHESCGHPTEADRLLEHEVAFAGTSFLLPEERGRLRYGSAHVSVTADATVPGGMGTFGWDDDGVPARRTPLVERGVFTGYLTSRETAGALDLPHSGGSARAESWQHFPIVRMVNVSLEPGPLRYAELLRDVDDGILMLAPASYSLDDKRENFHFSAQACRAIRRGQLEGWVRPVAFQSRTPAFWGRCDGVADDWELHGFVSCAKGEPLQLMRVGHGAAHARFRDVPIEVGE